MIPFGHFEISAFMKSVKISLDAVCIKNSAMLSKESKIRNALLGIFVAILNELLLP